MVIEKKGNRQRIVRPWSERIEVRMEVRLVVEVVVNHRGASDLTAGADNRMREERPILAS